MTVRTNQDGQGYTTNSSIVLLYPSNSCEDQLATASASATGVDGASSNNYEAGATSMMRASSIVAGNLARLHE